MSRTQTPEEVEREMIEVLGEENGKLFYSIQNDFIFLLEKFKHFKELYMKDKSRVLLLSETAPFFFFSLQKLLIDDIVINITRLTESGQLRKKQNATIKNFLNRYDKDALSTEIIKRFNISKKSTEKLNEWRDKRVAHRDFEVHVNSKPIKLKYDVIETCLEDLKSLMRLLHTHFFQSDFIYDFFTPTGGAMALLNALDRSYRCKNEYFASQRENRQFNIDSIRPGYKSFK